MNPLSPSRSEASLRSRGGRDPFSDVMPGAVPSEESADLEMRSNGKKVSSEPTEDLNESSIPEAASEFGMVLYRIGYKVDKFLEVSDSSIPAAIWSAFIMITILFSISCFVIQTQPAMSHKHTVFFDTTEGITTMVFLLEYLLRLSVCRIHGTFWGFILNKLNICDLLAICPFFIELTSQPADSTDSLQQASDTEALRVFRAVRLIRVLRLLKLGRNSLGVKVLLATLHDSAQALRILILWLVLSLVFFSSAIFYAERYACPGPFSSIERFSLYEDYCTGNWTLGALLKFDKCCVYRCDETSIRDFPGLCQYGYTPEHGFPESLYFWKEKPIPADGEMIAEPVHSGDPVFYSITRAAWWAMATMTTVGYGDAVPDSLEGKLIATLTMMCGILTIALPVAIIGTKFNYHYYTKRREVEKARFEVSAHAVSPTFETNESEHEDHFKRQMGTNMGVDLTALLEEAQNYKKELLAAHLRVNVLMQRLTQEVAALLEDSMRDSGMEEPSFTKRSLFIFSLDNGLRKWCLMVASSSGFDAAVFVLILLNTAIFVMQSPWQGPDYWPKVLEESTEIWFLLAFSIEMSIKVIAVGFCRYEYSYLRDGWNWLDFTVVVTGWAQIILASIVGTVSFDFLRIFRVLRPLRSVSTVPGMRALVQAVLASVSNLSQVVTMLLFIIVVFGILGMNFWGGKTHRRCRLTNSPLVFAPNDDMCVGNDWCFTPGSPDFQFWCMRNVSVPGNVTRRIPRIYDSQDCYNEVVLHGDIFVMWPIDLSSTHVCNGLDDSCHPPDVRWYANEHIYSHTQLRSLSEDRLKRATCGCSIKLVDESGAENGPHQVEIKRRRVNQVVNNFHRENEIRELNHGLTHFDNIASAFVVIFQSITLEGWVDIMYMLMDASSLTLPVVYYLLLVLFGSFFLINVTLAIVSNAFREAEQEDGVDDSHELETEENDLYFKSPAPSKSKSTHPVVRAAEAIAFSEIFQTTVMLAISANVIVMGLDTFPPSTQKTEEFADALNSVFLALFVIECVVLNIALGMPRYWTTPVHVFDGLVVVVGLLFLLSGGGSGGGGATAVRAVRLLRIFKLAKKWTSFRMLLKSMFATILQMSNYFFLLVLIILVFALAGQSFFATRFVFDENGRPIEECATYQNYYANKDYCQKVCPFNTHNSLPECVPKSHFDTLWWAWMTVFQILSGENWNTVMYDGMMAGGNWFFLFFFLVVIFGSFVILNLCLAILMNIFEEQTTHNRMIEEEINRANQRKFSQPRINLLVESLLQQKADDRNKHPVHRQLTKCYAFVTKHSKTLFMWMSVPRVLLIFPIDGPVVKYARRAMTHERFDQIILVAIIISSTLMIFNEPLLDPAGSLKQTLNAFNILFTMIFLMECVVKVCASCFIWNSQTGDFHVAYLRNGWNVLDFLVLLISLADLLLAGEDVSFLKALRTLRALRPLRLISRLETLKLVVNTLLQAIPELFNLLLVCALILLIFSLLFVALYRGRFSECINGDMEPVAFRTNFSTGEYLAGTPLCINHNYHNVITMASSREDCEAEAGRTFHQRLSLWTPICVLHCQENVESGLCAMNATWGYNVMTCTDCKQFVRQEFEVEPFSEDDDEECLVECTTATKEGHYCSVLNEKHQTGALTDEEVLYRAECVAECLAQCQAGSGYSEGYYCEGLYDESAWCVEQGHKWASKIPQDFDNVGRGMLTLFEIATTEGWLDVMWASVAANRMYTSPMRDAHEYHAFFYFIYLFFGSFFMFNLFVGVTIDNFNRIRHARKQSGIFLTDAQDQWVQSQKSLFALRHIFPLTNLHLLPPGRRMLFFFISSRGFENFIMSSIILNTICMGSQVHPTPSGHENLYTEFFLAANYIFATIFNIEAVLKLGTLRLAYFAERWNCFDFFCVLATDVGIFLELVVQLPVGSVMSAIRLFRIARLFRLVRFMKGLNKLFSAFFLSLPKLVNVAMFLLLCLFIFAVLCLNIFSTVRQIGTNTNHVDFTHFGVIIITLVRCMTGEGWNQLMHDLSKTPFEYKSLLEINCKPMKLATHEDWQNHFVNGEIAHPIACGSSGAKPFFIFFTLVVTFVALNLVIAIILEAFDDSSKSGDSDIILVCMNVWKNYDPEYTLKIPLQKAIAFVEEVSSSGPMKHILDEKEKVQLHSFDLHTARILRFELCLDDCSSVTFFSAVLAVFRYCIIHSKSKKRASVLLSEVEKFERLGCHGEMCTSSNLHLRAISESLINMHGKQIRMMSDTMNVDRSTISFDQQVAAAKIQVRWKQLIRQRRRPESTYEGTGLGEDPIARAAG